MGDIKSALSYLDEYFIYCTKTRDEKTLFIDIL